ncbi:MAG: hypothetical protein ACI4U5_05090 [Bacilli bacterium]
MSTRNSFKRKIIAFGLVLFISISLISTGFAAWVMSTRGESENNGNVSVGTVEGAQITIDSVTVKNENDEAKIILDTLSDDNTGRVRHKEATDGEAMKITITITISNPEFVGTLNVRFVAPEGIKNAIDANYITVESGSDLLTYDKNTGGMLITLTDTDREASYTKVLEFEFGWGTVFGSENPGVYYDSVSAGMAVSDAEVMKTLEIFRATVYGYETELAEKYTAIESAETTEAKNAAIAEKEALIASYSTLPQFLVYVVANPK